MSKTEPRLREVGESLHATALIDLEVVQVVRRLTINGELSARRGQQVVDDLTSFPMRRYPHLPFVSRIWQLRSNLTAIDAAYVAIAEELNAPLLTRDVRLKQTTAHRATIELV